MASYSSASSSGIYIWAAGLGRGTSVRVPGCIKGPVQSLVLQVSTSCYQGIWMHVYDCASLLKPFVTYCRGKTTTHRWLMHLKSIGMWSSAIKYCRENQVCVTAMFDAGVWKWSCAILFLLVRTLTLVMCALPVQRYSDLSVCGCAPFVPIHVHIQHICNTYTVHIHVANDSFRAHAAGWYTDTVL